jgi:hypothetical protein
MPSLNLEAVDYLPLRGGFLLPEITMQTEPMFDAMGRPALAKTSIVGTNLKIELAAANRDLDQMSISIYHEVLEGAAVAASQPPLSVCSLNEAERSGL